MCFQKQIEKAFEHDKEVNSSNDKKYSGIKDQGSRWSSKDQKVYICRFVRILFSAKTEQIGDWLTKSNVVVVVFYKVQCWGKKDWLNPREQVISTPGIVKLYPIQLHVY